MRKTLLYLLLVTFLCVAGASAQSGRRIKPTPTPTPAVEDEGGYSESSPSKPRTIYSPTKADKDKKPKGDKKAEGLDTTGIKPGNDTGATANADDVIKVETNLVTIPVSVYDRNGLYIPNLRRSDFQLFENGKPQEIAYFGTSDKPFSVVLLIDVSPSTAYKIEQIQEAATAFVDQLKPEDSVTVTEFNGSVTTLTESTTDRQRIYQAIRKAGFGDGTSLYDAVHISIQKRLSKVEGRKAIVLFTDGVDTTSHKSTYDKSVGEAEESEAMIFPIYFNTYFDTRRGVMSSPFPFPGSQQGSTATGNSSADYALGRQYLEDLASATGGRVFRPESTPGGLNAAFEGIAQELRSQYNIGYYPQDAGAAGERKQIKVRVARPNVVVRSRDSYIVGTPSAGK
jgi:Ca-activated chloride channel homolog